MEHLYQIGTHQFETEEEYRRALQDYEYIQMFMKELNLQEAQIAKELYQKLEQSVSLMKTPLGEAFKDQLVKLFVAKEVKHKKDHLKHTESQTLGERLRRATKENSMKWYWTGFLISTAFWILYLLFGVLVGTGSSRGVTNGDQIIYEIWNLFAMYGGYLFDGMILWSIGLLFVSLLRMLHKKVESVHKLNLLLVSGGMLCVYLYVTSFVRQGISGL